MTADTPIASHPHRHTDLGENGAWRYVALAVFAVAWGGNEFTPLLTMYRSDAGLSAVTVDLLLFAYVAGIVPGLLISGTLSDHFGRKPLMLFGPPVSLVGSLIIALAHDSAIILGIGRVLCGSALGIAMTVGGAWLKELSVAPFDPTAGRGAGARRAAMSLTAGFGLGALFAGLLAQFAPLPSALPYFLHIALCTPATVLLVKVVETRQRSRIRPSRRKLLADLRVPTALHPRTLTVVLVVSPWVFGAAGTAYAILPAVMSEAVGDYNVLFAAALCMVGLTCGFFIQRVAGPLDSEHSARSSLVALATVAAGMALAAAASHVLTLPVSILAAAVLGMGYGLCLLSGLQEVQRIAGPRDLAGLTAVFYSVSYLGFAFPAILAAASQWLSYPQMLLIGCGMAVLFFGIVALNSRKHLPGEPSAAASA